MNGTAKVLLGQTARTPVSPRFAGLRIYPSAAKRYFPAAGCVAVPFTAWSFLRSFLRSRRTQLDLAPKLEGLDDRRLVRVVQVAADRHPVGDARDLGA